MGRFTVQVRVTYTWDTDVEVEAENEEEACEVAEKECPFPTDMNDLDWQDTDAEEATPIDEEESEDGTEEEDGR